MTSLRFFGGVGEIGGNRILVEAEDTRIFLDFGKSFGKEKQYYDVPFSQPKTEDHLLELGLLPDLEGLYKDAVEPSVDGIFVSHPHLDHWGYTCFLDNRIPLYCGADTKDMILCNEFISSQGPSKDYYLGNLTKSGGEEVYKEFRLFRGGGKVQVGPIEVEPFPVDHSIPAAYGFLIHTPSDSIAYTGDFRLHGPRKDVSQNFVRKVAQSDVDLLLTEATNMTRADESTEASVREKFSYIIQDASGLVMTAFSVRDLDRLMSIYEAAQSNARKLAISMKQAYLLQNLRGSTPHLALPELSDEDLLVFRKEKSCTYAWEEEVLRETNAYTGSDLNQMQEDIVLVASLYYMNEVMEVDPQPGSVFVLSKSEPFDEEGVLQHEKLLHWCEHFGLPLYQIHASGHVMPYDLKAAIDEMHPRTVIPIHTESPYLFKRFIADLEREVTIPELGTRLLM
ncbi:MAG: hypothetical protein GWN86_15225 [Desulfobacterales bacterium]|nr:hypothetical protein [Desulfobacterales bacterium]